MSKLYPLIFVLTVLTFLIIGDLFSNEKSATSTIRWWDCNFLRPAAEVQIIQGTPIKLTLNSVTFAMAGPGHHLDELGDPLPYLPKIDRGQLSIIVEEDKLRFSVREDALGPVAWPHTHAVSSKSWNEEKPIEATFKRELLKGSAEYSLRCTPRK